MLLHIQGIRGCAENHCANVLKMSHQRRLTKAVLKGAVKDVKDCLSLWFFIAMAIGFLVGFWGIFGSLVINRSWRHKYFKLVSKLTDWIRLTMALMTVKL
ncbi:hypothetical protein ES332_D08G242800v1 [Gossypium tomentosum]|uniref:Uncharacterized protein n=1 Tax=Gossypium tomentosum TaxID=34277 RepID=A0A5D2JYY3_GOSTO|nr:hypothetical protein ES332_D08G242800v1 [Gossypium tomentosum]